jgi:serine/threonine protein kinase
VNTTFGRYRLLERLGQGGMAEVFKAKSYGVEGFEKVVVIKRILPALAESDQFVEMFIHEAKLAVRLSHANVVQVFDLGLAPGTVVGGMPSADAYYMAMEYVSGLDLATLLARCRRQQVKIPIEMAVYVAAEVAKGLDHAHRRRDEQNQPLTYSIAM